MPKQPVADIIEELYRQMDPLAEEAVKKLKTSCTKGCYSCCYLLTTSTIPEGLLIAEKLLKKPNWESLLPKLRAASLDHSYKGVNKASYFTKKKLCVFLTEEKTCGIYETRPACCRFHYVVSPPEMCHPDHPVGHTAIVDLRKLEEVIWKVAMDVNKEVFNYDAPIVAPIPIMVLFCMELVTRKDQKANRLIQEACKGIHDPASWLKLNLKSLMSEGSGMESTMTEEELVPFRVEK